MKNEMKIGLVGLGNAGRALAAPLIANCHVVGYDRDPSRVESVVRMGGHAASDLNEISGCDVILLSLPTPQSSHSVCEALTANRLDGKVIIETSTVAPTDIERMATEIAAVGGTVVDAAIVGGIQRLKEGKTTFLVGAAPDDYARAEPVLSLAAEEIFHLGGIGSGMRAKLINNAIAHTTMVTILEGAALAKKVGVPLSVYYKLMTKESGLTRPLTHRFGERIKHQDFEGGMPTDNARKDSGLALDLAYEHGVPLFTMQASHTIYDIAAAQGLGQLDYASISKVWEQWLDIEFGFGDE